MILILWLQDLKFRSVWLQNLTVLFLPFPVNRVKLKYVGEDVGLVPATVHIDSVLVQDKRVVCAGSWHLFICFVFRNGVPSTTLNIEQRQVIEICSSLARVAPKEVNLPVVANAVASASGCWFLLSLLL